MKRPALWPLTTSVMRALTGSHPHQGYNEYLLLSSFQSFVCHINNSFCGVQRENNFPEGEKQQSTPCPRALISVSCPGCMLRGSLSALWENLQLPSLEKQEIRVAIKSPLENSSPLQNQNCEGLIKIWERVGSSWRRNKLKSSKRVLVKFRPPKTRRFWT